MVSNIGVTYIDITSDWSGNWLFLIGWWSISNGCYRDVMSLVGNLRTGEKWGG